MKHVLDAVDRERTEVQAVLEQCRQRLATLEEIEQLAIADPTAVVAELPAPEPLALPARSSAPPAPARRAKRADVGAIREPVLKAIRDLQPARRGQVNSAVNAPADEVKRVIVELEKSGQVRRTGKGAGTRYHVAAPAEPQPRRPPAPTPAPPRPIAPPAMSARTRRAVQRDAAERQAPPKPPDHDGTPDEERFKNPNRPEGIRLRQMILDRCRQRPMTKRQLAQLLVVPLVEVGVAVDRIQRHAGDDEKAPALVKDSTTGAYHTEDRA